MKSRKGFSLVELLTVIAIIAILAAIIFPVMAAVKERARQNDCMTKLHQIAMGVKMYKTDNNKYPELLTPVVAGSGGAVLPLESAKGDGLFAAYVKTAAMFHCPSSKVTKTSEIAEFPKLPYDSSSDTIASYAYNGYDAYVTGVGPVYSGDQVQRHYATDWADEPGTVAALDPYGIPPGDDTEQRQQEDYERQLKFRTPPENTVITWCSWHEAKADTGVATGDALVVFLDGSADKMKAAEVEKCRWRTRPRL